MEINKSPMILILLIENKQPWGFLENQLLTRSYLFFFFTGFFFAGFLFAGFFFTGIIPSLF